ncbi:hypothetical protein JCM12141A_22970 [Mycolicibacterium hodleri]
MVGVVVVTDESSAVDWFCATCSPVVVDDDDDDDDDPSGTTCSYRFEVSAPPELRTVTPGAGSIVDPEAWPGPDEPSDPDPAATEPAPAGGVDPPDDTTSGSVFEPGSPDPGPSTCDAPGEGSADGSATTMPGWATAAAPKPKATTRAPAHRRRFVLLTADAPRRRASDVVLPTSSA